MKKRKRKRREKRESLMTSRRRVLTLRRRMILLRLYSLRIIIRPDWELRVRMKKRRITMTFKRLVRKFLFSRVRRRLCDDEFFTRDSSNYAMMIFSSFLLFAFAFVLSSLIELFFKFDRIIKFFFEKSLIIFVVSINAFHLISYFVLICCFIDNFLYFLNFLIIF